MPKNETTLGLLKFDQREGFAIIDLPEEARWPVGDDERKWLDQLGYVDTIWTVGHAEYDENTIVAYELHNEGMKGLPAFLVVVSNFDSDDYIFVEDKPSYMALRVLLAPVFLAHGLDAYLGRQLGQL